MQHLGFIMRDLYHVMLYMLYDLSLYIYIDACLLCVAASILYYIYIIYIFIYLCIININDIYIYIYIYVLYTQSLM